MHHAAAGVRIVTADEARALDARCIAGGTPGSALMQRAGAAAAGEIARRLASEVHRGVLVLAGPGNNGGDGWVIARSLHAAAVPVQVWTPGRPGTKREPGGDAARERHLALADGVATCESLEPARAAVVVDALLGTGATGAPREAMAAAVRWTREARRSGTVVVAIDMPTGVDATTGEVAEAAVQADLTLTFGNLKRGHLVARERCGRIVVLDIGLERQSGVAGNATTGSVPAASQDASTLPVLLDAATALALLPPIAADAHKGSNKRIAIVGGGAGMAGAVVLAAQGALRAGAGLVKTVVHRDSRDAVTCAVPQALTATWGTGGGTQASGVTPEDARELARELADWADAIAIGPGLGQSADAGALLEALLAHGDTPVVLDADALNMLAGDGTTLHASLRARPTLLTPHPLEMMRLTSAPDVATVLRERFEIGAQLARQAGATVLLKGTPTVIGAPSGERLVTTTGTPALATGGSGDVLTGMAATLMAQLGDPLRAGAVAAWAHGRAAEIATARAGTSRGVPLDSVLAEMAHLAWAPHDSPSVYPVLCELP